MCLSRPASKRTPQCHLTQTASSLNVNVQPARTHSCWRCSPRQQHNSFGAALCTTWQCEFHSASGCSGALAMPLPAVCDVDGGVGTCPLQNNSAETVPCPLLPLLCAQAPQPRGPKPHKRRDGHRAAPLPDGQARPRDPAGCHAPARIPHASHAGLLRPPPHL